MELEWMRIERLYQEQIGLLIMESQIKWHEENRFISDVEESRGSHPGRNVRATLVWGQASPVILLHHPRCASSLFKFNSCSKMALETLVQK